MNVGLLATVRLYFYNDLLLWRGETRAWSGIGLLTLAGMKFYRQGEAGLVLGQNLL